MSIRTWLAAPRVRRGLAASAVVLAAGGLILARTPAGAASSLPAAVVAPAVEPGIPAQGSNLATFSGPGVHGTFALSHTLVLAGGEQRLFGELALVADAAAGAHERAPLSMAIVLDTSGSMTGDKIRQAKDAVVRLVGDLRDDDEVAFIRYSDTWDLVQPLARAGGVRTSLIERVRALEAGGGTSIAPALAEGLRALGDAASGRVRRVVLASDGLDATRAQSEAVAKQSAGRGVTVSSMGIGLDFDESYMGGVAQAGHGNFAFVNDGDALARFLHREMEETAATTVERATARLKLPPGVRFVRAVGAEARSVADGTEIELSMGSLFAGDKRRVAIELAARMDAGDVRSLEGRVSWFPVGGAEAEARFAGLALTGSTDARAVDAGRDGSVLARSLSATASIRQIEAAEAYNQGDVQRAQALIDQNKVELAAAATAAPAPAAAALEQQIAAYEQTKQAFGSAKPRSAMGSAAAKRSVEKDLSNTGRDVAF
jgi:Ca-activated chloride channel homolog